jgi:hypothetical protein
MSNSQNCGIAEILEVILILQKNASCPSGTLDSCDRPVLGSCSSCCVCNTRPVMLYMCGDPSTPLSMPTTKESGMSGELTYSTVFRVEKVENGSATFRVLALNPDETSLNEYITTNSLFTCNLGCVCSIRCLNDTCIENL